MAKAKAKAKPKPKVPRGRPTDYRAEFVEQARKLCEFGATDVDMGAFFGVRRETIWAWAQKYPDFSNALKVGKEAADERVGQSLYHRAVGYSHEAVKIFMPAGAKEPVYAPFREHLPPDTTAAIFWLKNRRPKDWREKQEVDHSLTVTLADLVGASLKGEGDGK